MNIFTLLNGNVDPDAEMKPEEEEEVVEIEYCYFIRMTPEQTRDFWEKYRDVDSEIITEISMAFDPDSDMKGRIRRYKKSTGDKPTFELTTKVPAEDVKNGKVEYNDNISEANYNMLAHKGAKRSVRTRVKIPVLRPSDNTPVMGKDGPLKWEVDFFVDASTVQSFQAGHFHPWAKVELEVDRAELDSVVSMIPFEYQDIVDNDTTSEQDRAQIGSFYSGYQLSVKGK